MININDNHMIIKNRMVRNQWHSRYPEISMVRSVYVYSEIIYSGKCTSSNNFILSFS